MELKNWFGPGFATGEELRQFSWSPAGFYLGQAAGDIPGCAGEEIGIDDDRAVFICAGSRSGKGVNLIINNLLTWPGGLVVLDPKGENAAHTAIRRGTAAGAQGSGSRVRRFLGQDVAVLDPFRYAPGPARVYKARYNPLLDLDPTSIRFTGDVWSVAAGMVIADRSTPAGDHFTKMSDRLLCGVIEAAVRYLPPEGRTLSTVADMALNFGALEPFLASLPPSPMISAALGLLQETGADERGSFLSTLTGQLKWLDEPLIRDHTAESDFSLRRAVQAGNWSVYIVLPPNKMDDFARWMRVLVATAMNAKIAQGVYEHTGPQTLFMLDEMPTLGHFDMVERGVGYIPGYGVKICGVVQNLSQLKTLYKDNWRTFLGNTASSVFFGFNDDEGPEYVSKRLGQFEYIQETEQESQGQNRNIPEWRGRRWFNGRKPREHESRGSISQTTGTNRNRSPALRAVLRPEEVVQRTSRQTGRMIALMADGRPIYLASQPYWKRFSSSWYETRDNIIAIEKRLQRMENG